MSIKKTREPSRRNSVLRNQALIYIAIILTGIIVISVLYNTATVGYYRQQTTELAGSVLRQTEAALEDKTEQYRHMLEMLSLNPKLQKLLFDEYYYDLPRMMARREILTYLEPMDGSLNDMFTEVTSITFYSANKTLVENEDPYSAEEPGAIVYLEDARQEPWVSVMESLRMDRLQWLVTLGENGEKKLSAIKTMRNLKVVAVPGNFLGYVKMDFNIEQFFHNILGNRGSKDQWLLVTDATNSGVASTLDPALQRQAARLATSADADGWRTIKLDGQSYLVSGVQLKGTDWMCWYALSEGTLSTGFRQVNLPVLLLTIAMAAAMAIAAWMAASRLARRIGKLAGAMRGLEKGQFDIRVEDHGQDEIAFLATGFNKMAARLDEHVTREYRDRIRQREYDMQALQAQLHPHFLYNSLASISWLGMQNGSEDIPAISNALARFYRLSLSRGKNIIQVSDEADQARAYLDVMAIRYRGRINVLFKIGRDVADAWTLKLVLQPFVENALLHGLHVLKDHINLIISAEREDGMLVWKVIDDGVGIPSDQLPDMNGGDETRAGYGIANVHRRIRMYFGEEYGVTLMSEEGIGTAVRICMPLLEKQPTEC